MKMAVLSDRDLKKLLAQGKLVLGGVPSEQINPSSIDLRLGNKFRIFKHSEITHIDPSQKIPENLTELIEKSDGEPFIIHPGEFILGMTKECVSVPPDLTARLDGKSSWGRLGIVIHSTAGTVDPGFEGNLALEITNISQVPVCLRPGARIAKITFEQLTSESELPYNKRKDSKYAHQSEPRVSKLHEESK
jgi:dCTP deaminase